MNKFNDVDTARVSIFKNDPTRNASQAPTQQLPQTPAIPPSSFPTNADMWLARDNAFAIPTTAPQKKKKKWPFIVAAATVGVIALAYGAGVFLYSGRFFPQTSLGTLDLSNKSFTQAVSIVDNAQKNYKVNVSGQDLNFTVNPTQSGMKVDAQALVDNASNSVNMWAWPIEIFKKHDLNDSGNTSLDSDELTSYVSQEVEKLNATKTESSDARIEYDADADSFHVIPEVEGDQLNVESVVASVSSCILQHKDTCSITEKNLIRPNVYADDDNTKKGLKAANDILGVNVTLKTQRTGKEAGVVNADLVGQWITFDKNNQPSVSEQAMAAWVNQAVAPLGTVGVSRTYTRPDGKVINVSGGSFGCSVDKEKAVAQVNEAITAKSTGTIELAMSCSGNHAPEGSPREWGAYVDVDLGEQRARFYNDAGNVIWESGVISGNVSKGNGTPTGVWFVNNKQPGTTLLGRMLPTGKREYETHVDYWMPFQGNMVGFHDAPWQQDENFGKPDAYRSVGSHGCVNLPTASARSLYSAISVGTPVVVHY